MREKISTLIQPALLLLLEAGYRDEEGWREGAQKENSLHTNVHLSKASLPSVTKYTPLTYKYTHTHTQQHKEGTQ